MQQIIEGYTAQGFTDFILSLGYKAELIEHHFGDGAAFGCSIRYVREHEPLGTAGSLCLLPTMQGPFIVHNGDVLARFGVRDLLEFHSKRPHLATVCAALHQHQVEYGVVEIDHDVLVAMREKPIEAWTINAGIYVLEPQVIETMPEGPSNMPDVLQALPEGRVGVYQIDGYWSDVGNFIDLAKANQEWTGLSWQLFPRAEVAAACHGRI